MSDEGLGANNPDQEPDTPVAELAEFRIEAHPDLEGRVHRDINRRNLVADSLDFSLTVMLQTFWEYLRSAIDSWPNGGESDSEPPKRVE